MFYAPIIGTLCRLLCCSDKPTEVRLGIYVNSFYSISEQTMVCYFYLWQLETRGSVKWNGSHVIYHYHCEWLPESSRSNDTD